VICGQSDIFDKEERFFYKNSIQILSLLSVHPYLPPCTIELLKKSFLKLSLTSQPLHSESPSMETPDYIGIKDSSISEDDIQL
jgi:hypothetical protein